MCQASLATGGDHKAIAVEHLVDPRCQCQPLIRPFLSLTVNLHHVNHRNRLEKGVQLDSCLLVELFRTQDHLSLRPLLVVP